MTRLFPKQDLTRGILPVHERPLEIFETCASTAREAGHEADALTLRRELANSDDRFAELFRSKQRPGQAGPFGFLNRDIAWDGNGELQLHFHTEAPESIADVFRAVGKSELEASFRELTDPVIAHFDAKLSPNEARTIIREAGAAAWRYLQNGSLGTGSDCYCIDCKGIAVPPSRVVRLERLS